MVTRSEAERLAEDPVRFFGYSYEASQELTPRTLNELHLHAARSRLEALRDRIPVLGKLANSQGIAGLSSLDDLAPLLFEHTIYKSYPVSLLTNSRFDQLTRWLSRLTTVDLSGLDTSECDSIDSWIDLLRARTPVRLAHSSGTSGIMSFLPLHEDEVNIRFGTQPAAIIRAARPSFTALGTQDDPLNMHVVYPYFRSGGKSVLLRNDALVACVAGNEERFHAAYPGRLSSDVEFLAARVRAAQARGSSERLEIAPTLRARKEEFDRLNRDMPTHIARFFDVMAESLAGQAVFMTGTWNILYQMAAAGLAKGRSGVFAANSFIQTGGGAKGLVPPRDWREKVQEFIGVESLDFGYGMSEVSGTHMACTHGNYHLSAWVVPFVLDPDDGHLLPREGRRTGRAAFFDLLPSTHWGGFVTGDEVTFDFDGGCPCGRGTPYFLDPIGRFSEKRGGDDKISCAATPEAVADAFEFLNKFND